MDPTEGAGLDRLLTRIEEREAATRRRTVLLSLVPIAVAVVVLGGMVLGIKSLQTQLAQKQSEVLATQQEIDRLKEQVRNFWTPKMRDDLRPHLERETAELRQRFGVVVDVDARPRSEAKPRREGESGVPLFDYEIRLVAVRSGALEEIGKVRYEMPPGFVQRVLWGHQRTNGFLASYRGWDCPVTPERWLVPILVSLYPKGSDVAAAPTYRVDICTPVERKNQGPRARSAP